MALGHRIGERRELGYLDRGIEKSLFVAKVGDRIDLENRVVSTIVLWSQDVGLIVVRGILAEHFLGAF